ncbi:hypothetical protein CJ030_MR2G020361 [Morella rubra]|uniref:Uncharacterized protein n=1 Tax=Morella rubra TaxID=262757 RepID=A0A6A1W7Q9_9ROSI|nr:hypothetical protein CJ030_MR2G020361 [Morella rubra]
MSGVKRARTTRTGTGSSSQEQEVADPMMTLERRMEYLRGRPVAKERPVTLSDFDQLLYEEHSLYQLFEYQGFLHQLSWTEGFCVDAVVQDFFCALVSVDRAPEVQLEQTRIDFSLYMFELIMDEAWEIKEYSLPYGVFLTQFLISRGVVIAASDTRKEVKSALNKFTLSRSRGQEGALTRRFARRAAAAAEEASRPSTSASEAPMETGAPAVPPPWVAQLFADLDSRVGATVKATLQHVESEQNKKNRSKLTVNHAAGSRSFQRTRACMKNQESGNINPAELYKKNYTNKDGIWTSEGAREIYERMDAFQRQCDLEGKTYTEIEHQLAKARDEIEAMRAAREKDLQEFAKKQAEMEATLRDHREEQRVEQERIRLEQEERTKREQERMRVEHEECMQQEQERMRKEQERLWAEISKELEKKMSSVMEKKMSDMSK